MTSVCANLGFIIHTLCHYWAIGSIWRWLEELRVNTLHAEIIYTSPFINAEIKIICLRSKWQVLLSKLQAFPAAGFAKVARNKAGLVYLNC